MADGQQRVGDLGDARQAPAAAWAGATARVNRLAEPADLFHTLTWLAAGAAATAGLPETRARAFARAWARAAVAARPGRARALRRQIERYLPPGRWPEAALPPTHQLAVGITASYVEEQVLFRLAARDAAWHPPARLLGGERLDGALARGRGAVLWTLPMQFSLVWKAVLHHAGYRPAHLTHWTHGPSPTRFGRRFLGGPQIAVERRYVDHVVIPPEGAAESLRELGRRLRNNGLVSIKGIGRARRPVEVPFLADRARLASGAPRLAISHGAPLLVLDLTREGEDGPFTVTIRPIGPGEEPDGGPPAAGRTDRDALTAAANERVREFAALLERRVLENPTMWAIHQPQYR